MLARSSAATGAWAGIVALAVQNLVDLGSEVPGLMLAPVVCAAMVVGGTAGREPRFRVERWTKASRAVALVAGALGVCALVSATTTLGRELDDDQRKLHAAVMDDKLSADDLTALARSAMLRHPAEPYLPFIVAVWFARERSDSPIAWIDATLERARIHGPAHMVLARWLARRSRSQARLEYRLAMEQAPTLIWTIMQEAPALVSGYYDATELVPDGGVGAATLNLLVPALELRLPATSKRLDDELAQRAPWSPEPTRRAVRAAVEDIEAGGGAPWCQAEARGGCEAAALNLSERLRAIEPGQCEPHQLRARVGLASGHAQRALKELSEAADTVTNRVECLQAMVNLAARARDESREDEALGKIVSAGCGNDVECANNFTWVANVQRQRGNARLALALYKRAYERAPDATDVLQTMADLAASLGLHGEAASDYEQLARKRPAQPQWRKAANDQRNAALGASLHM
jgi:tetratricopeptide (TPR) repeat protein